MNSNVFIYKILPKLSLNTFVRILSLTNKGRSLFDDHFLLHTFIKEHIKVAHEDKLIDTIGARSYVITFVGRTGNLVSEFNIYLDRDFIFVESSSPLKTPWIGRYRLYAYKVDRQNL